MIRTIFFSTITILGISLFPSLTLAQESIPLSIICGDTHIVGNIDLIDTSQTTVSVDLIDTLQGDTQVLSSDLSLQNGGYTVTIDPTSYMDRAYTLQITAQMGDQSTQREKEIMLGNQSCSSIQALQERVEAYADEAQEYFQHAKETQKVPPSFLKTGLGDLLEKTIAQTEQRFALSSSRIYYDVPTWSYSPDSDSYTSFAGQYELLPPEHQNAHAYFRFKGLLIPIQPSDISMSEKALLDMLNQGAVVAPETDSLEDIGVVKMLYTHAVSTTKSPFAGVGSHLSVFSEQGDELKVYTKIPGYSASYEEKTYFLQHKLELLPEETDTLHNFKQEGADILAFITCKFGNVLGSLDGREVLLFNRKTEELGDFQNAIINMSSSRDLQAVKDAMDRYFARKDLSDTDVHRLVSKLEELEKSDTNQLKIIATYGKYMASYDAIYN